MKQALLFLIVLLSIQPIGCKKDNFQYSPYQTSLDDSYKNTTQINLDKIKAISQGADDTVYTLALLSDPHFYIDELKKAVEIINADTTIAFTVVTGDFADQGLLNEFKLFHETMDGLNKPYLTVIGNHDYLSNGETIYDAMFGARNYITTFRNTKLIFFDDVFWESNKTPDFGWLEKELQDSFPYSRKLVFAHIPPESVQFDTTGELHYAELMKKYNVDLSINGHVHVYQYHPLYPDSVPYLILPYLRLRTLVKLSVSPSKIDVQTSTF